MILIPAKDTMAQPAPRPPRPDPAGMPVSAANLATTVQYLVFEPGLYALDLNTPRPASTDIGLFLPAIRLDTAPPTPSRPGRACVVGPTREGWIWRGDDAVFVLVAGGQAGMLLTIYRANDGMAAPEIRFRTVHPLLGQSLPSPPPPGPPPVQASGRRAPSAAGTVDAAAVPLRVLAHVSGVGDVRRRQGQWLGVAGSGKTIEGFAVEPEALLDPKAVEYQAILGNNWSTPWFAGGEYCGSRGLLLPLLGFRVRLAQAAADYECLYWGQFIGGQTTGPHHDGEACQAGDAPLEAIQVVIRRRAAPAASAPAVTAARTPKPSPAPPLTLPRVRARRTAAVAAKPDSPTTPPRRRKPKGGATG
jgi:hypothetical protein